VIKSNFPHSHSKPNDYVVAERRRDALTSCYPSNPLARNLVILAKVEFVVRIPTKPAMHSNLKPATYTDLKAATVPI